MRMKATLLKGKPEAGANHLPTEKGNDTVVHRRVSILLSATRGITYACLLYTSDAADEL